MVLSCANIVSELNVDETLRGSCSRYRVTSSVTDGVTFPDDVVHWIVCSSALLLEHVQLAVHCQESAAVKYGEKRSTMRHMKLTNIVDEPISLF
jgi:hypothetical protein